MGGLAVWDGVLGCLRGLSCLAGGLGCLGEGDLGCLGGRGSAVWVCVGCLLGSHPRFSCSSPVPICAYLCGDVREALFL